MINAEKTLHISLSSALQVGRPPEGNLAIPIFSDRHLDIELYAPQSLDVQTPHSRNEVYIVARGSGFFFDGENNYPVGVGSFIFVAAGQEHRFMDFSKDFAVWVILYS